MPHLLALCFLLSGEASGSAQLLCSTERFRKNDRRTLGAVLLEAGLSWVKPPGLFWRVNDVKWQRFLNILVSRLWDFCEMTCCCKCLDISDIRYFASLSLCMLRLFVCPGVGNFPWLFLFRIWPLAKTQSRTINVKEPIQQLAKETNPQTQKVRF